MAERIDRIEAFVVTIPREEPYLGPLAADERPNRRGYFVRRGNRTLYPLTDRSVLVKVISSGGAVGWGETYGIAAPEAVTAIIDDVLAPFVEQRDPFDVQVIAEDLYDLMRVRGAAGGFYADAIAGLDIALWDLCGKLSGLPLHKLLGGERSSRIKAYVSGLPKATLEERCLLAKAWVDDGFDAVKIAAVRGAGIAGELHALRSTLGESIELMVDLHWKYTAAEAIRLIRQLEPAGLYFAEAPCRPEDIDGLGRVIAAVGTPVAAGEEWRTGLDALPRLSRGLSIVQPEMAHTGVTQFMRIARLAEAFHARVVPHAAIGIGLFQAASLHASAALAQVPYHEYQHSVFDRNLAFVTGDMRCEGGSFHVPTGAGLGVEPSEAIWAYAGKAR